MNLNILRFAVLCLASLILSCKEKRDLNSQSSRKPPESAIQAPDTQSQTPEPTQTIDPTYGILDKDGLPIDPGLGMNSGKITEEQRLELRQPLPKGYHIGQPIVPRWVIGRADDVEWREVGNGRFNLPSKDLLARLLGLDAAQIPPGIRGAFWVLKSPSGRRVIANSGVSDSLFEAKNGVVDVSSMKKIYCVNFDDKRRTFIIWDSFASESLLVGHLSDDEEIENVPSRQILYTYDIDKMLLRRVIFPKGVQEEIWDSFDIESVAPSALLLRWDKKKNPMTVDLDQ
jgi:hypothetical protein